MSALNSFNSLEAFAKGEAGRSSKGGSAGVEFVASVSVAGVAKGPPTLLSLRCLASTECKKFMTFCITCSWFTTVFWTPMSSCSNIEWCMLNSLYLSSRCRNCCWVATSCVLTKSICCVGPPSSRFAVGFRGAGAFRRMLSSASLLLALKSGCLNSQAYCS